MSPIPAPRAPRLRRLVAVVVLWALPAAAEAPRDVPWFQARPQALEEALRRCHRDARLMATADCQNAEAAAASRLGQPPSVTAPRTRSMGEDGLPPPDFNPRTNPLGFEALRRACAERGPGSEMFLPYCGEVGRYRNGSTNAR